MNAARASETSTIAAIATPPGAGERGVVRISGPLARALVERTFRAGSGEAVPRSRALSVGRFDDGRGEQPALLLWMPGPRSFTREDTAEFHLPGAPPLLEAALARLLELGARLAEPGEFTRRAFLSGRIDLSRAEGVLALVAARNEAERRASTALLLGGLAERTEALRERLETARALCEASLDFDEQDTGHVPTAEIEAELAAVAALLAEASGWERQRERAGAAARIVLAGLPNAGKSALFNALCGAERALVSEHAGTTRDALSAEIEIAGAAVRFDDTAGVDAEHEAAGASIRAGRDEARLDPDASRPEHQAQEIAAGARGTADLVLWVADALAPGAPESALAALAGVPAALLVWNKTDLAGSPPEPPRAWTEAWTRARGACAWVATAGERGLGLLDLRARIAAELGLGAQPLRGGERGEAAHAGLGLSRELAQRHQSALAEAARELARARVALGAGVPLELVAEDLRAATSALDRITGESTPEALLDRIFARFCLGK